MRTSWTAGGLFALALGCLLFTACTPKYRVVGRESESAVLSGDCPVRLLDQAPSTGFSILGEVKPEDPAKLTDDREAFLGQVRESVCRLTGDAVIAHKDDAGRFLGGSVIRMR